VVTKFEKRLIRAAKEAVAFARGQLEPGSYRVHTPDDTADLPSFMHRRVKVFHKAGPGMFRVGRKAGTAKHRTVARKKK
jgi:hypothetical protein